MQSMSSNARLGRQVSAAATLDYPLGPHSRREGQEPRREPPNVRRTS